MFKLIFKCHVLLSVIIVQLIFKKLNKGFKIPETGRSILMEQFHLTFMLSMMLLSDWTTEKNNKRTVYSRL